MKKILLFILFISVIPKFSACDCLLGDFAENYLKADFVAVISITETFGNSKYNRDGYQADIYKAKISVEKIYKGTPISELNIFGTTTYAESGACEVLMKPNEKYLVVLDKNLDGKYYIASCSTISIIDDNRTIESQLKTTEKLFKYLEKNKNNLKGIFSDYRDISRKWDPVKEEMTTDFSKNFGKKINGKFGIYRVKIDDDHRITEITTLRKSGLNEKKVQELMKKNIFVINYLNQNLAKEFLIYLKFY